MGWLECGGTVIIITVFYGGGGGGDFYADMLFITYNIRLESLLPAMQELLCFSQMCIRNVDTSLFYHYIDVFMIQFKR